MHSHWTPISAQRAERHQLDGIKGWLLAFAVLPLLIVLSDVAAVLGEPGFSDLSIAQWLALDRSAVTFKQLSLVIDLLLVLIIYGLMLVRATCFRTATTAILLSSLPLATLIGLAASLEGLEAAASQMVIPWALLCAVGGLYLHRSKRVRVTFEQHVDAKKAKAAIVAVAAAFAESAAAAAHPGPGVDSTADESFGSAFGEQNPETFDDIFWAQALRELEGSRRHAGLWARSFAQAKGDKAQAKVAYLNVRVRELDWADQQRVAKYRQARTLEAQAANDRDGEFSLDTAEIDARTLNHAA